MTEVTITVPGNPPIKTTTEAIRAAADAAEARGRRSRVRVSESMRDSAELAQEMAEAGL